MEEHFNENYLETEKYPKASFNGNINEEVDLSKDGTYEVTATGKLLIHGIEKERTLTGTITRNGNRSEERRVGKECRSRGSPYH